MKVDKDKIRELCDTYVRVDGRYEIDNEGAIHTTNDIYVGPSAWTATRNALPNGKLPVRFHVARSVDANDAGLTSLEGFPIIVTDRFLAEDNPQLTSLAGGPRIVGNAYSVRRCGLVSLDGAPKTVAGRFSIDRNKLTSLRGLEGTKITDAGYLDATVNPIATLDHLPQGNENISIYLSIGEIPVLRLVIKDDPRLIFVGSGHKLFDEIFDRYRGKGRAAVMPCAAELHKAGFGSNAKL